MGFDSPSPDGCGHDADKSGGAKPYGELPGEAAVIERMKGLRASGLGYDRIAAMLNGEGVKPRRGKQWWGLAVNKILGRVK